MRLVTQGLYYHYIGWMGQKEEADSQPGDRAGLGRHANLSQGLRASALQVLRQENGTVTPTYSPLCFWSARLFPRADSHSHSKAKKLVDDFHTNQPPEGQSRAKEKGRRVIYRDEWTLAHTLESPPHGGMWLNWPAERGSIFSSTDPGFLFLSFGLCPENSFRFESCLFKKNKIK